MIIVTEIYPLLEDFQEVSDNINKIVTECFVNAKLVEINEKSYIDDKDERINERLLSVEYNLSGNIMLQIFWGFKRFDGKYMVNIFETVTKIKQLRHPMFVACHEDLRTSFKMLKQDAQSVYEEFTDLMNDLSE